MKRKILIIIFILILILLISILYFDKKTTSKTDAQKFKDEYEEINGQEINGKTVRTLKIPQDNPFIYASGEDILELIANKETFVVYFGFAKCPWCRSVLSSLIDVANDINLDKIYYVDIENMRDTLTLDDNNEIITTKEKTSEYNDLLTAFSNVLEDYNLTSSNGEVIKTGEKRIYAPNIIAVVDGIAKEMTTGISEKQDDAYMELTDEIKDDSYDKIKCTIKCVVDSTKVCSIKSC